MDRREIQPRVGNGRGQDADSGQIKAEIDHTRGRIDQTLDALGEKLRPRNLLDEVFEYFTGGEGTGSKEVAGQVKGTAQKLSRSLWHQIQEHPMPSLLIGAGIAWMFSEQKQRRAYYGPQPASIRGEGGRLSESVSHSAHSARESAQGMAQSGKETLQGIAHAGQERAGAVAGEIQEKAHELREMSAEQLAQMKEKASNFGAQAKGQATAAMRSTEEKYHRAVEEYPLAMGLGFLAFGVIAGLALPHTRIEDRTLGKRADELKDQVRSQGQQIVKTVENVAMAAGSAAFEEAEKQGLSVQNLGEKIGRVASEAAQVVSEKAKEEGLDQGHVKEQVKSVGHEAKRAAQEEMNKSKMV
jgi:hypothetical protein